MSYIESQKWGRLTLRLVTSLGQVVDTNELVSLNDFTNLTVNHPHS
jgi:hypothetical protein